MLCFIGVCIDTEQHSCLTSIENTVDSGDLNQGTQVNRANHWKLETPFLQALNEGREQQ